LIVINISYKFIKASKGYFESIIQRVKRLILAISINFLENTRLKNLVKYHAGFCADPPKATADFMGAAQLPVAVAAFVYVFKDPAWKKKPTWYIVATQDHAIPPGLERKMDKRTGGKVFEIVSSHVIYMSHPEEVAKIIESAAAVAIVN